MINPAILTVDKNQGVLLFIFNTFLIAFLFSGVIVVSTDRIESGSKERTVKKMIWKIIGTAILIFLCYVIVGAIVPFIRQPQIAEETKEKFDLNQFYKTGESDERAAIISDNEEALKERIRLISHARERVVLSTFEFDADESGKDVLAALQDAAKRGVQVCVLADGMPSLLSMEGNPYFYALALTENVEIKIYNPINLLTPWKLMGRLHDKYLLVDETAYILGGRNTYDYFLGKGTGYINYDWDVLVYCKEGRAPSLQQLTAYYETIWNQSDSKDFYKGKAAGKFSKVAAAKEELAKRYEYMKEAHPDWFEDIDYKTVTREVENIQLLTNPTHVYAKEPVVYYKMTQLMQNAEKEVRFHTPYIICNDWMLERLKGMCKKDIPVVMMTNSVANNGNPFGAMDYERHKGEILETGVNILEYDGGVSYHGKCFTIDDSLVGIGSFNWDMRSAYLDTEMMLVINSEQLNADMKREMARYEAQALTVVDEDTAIPPQGMSPREISLKKKVRNQLLQLFGSWARFLM